MYINYNFYNYKYNEQNSFKQVLIVSEMIKSNFHQLVYNQEHFWQIYYKFIIKKNARQKNFF